MLNSCNTGYFKNDYVDNSPPSSYLNSKQYFQDCEEDKIKKRLYKIIREFRGEDRRDFRLILPRSHLIIARNMIDDAGNYITTSISCCGERNIGGFRYIILPIHDSCIVPNSVAERVTKSWLDINEELSKFYDETV
jgi:hypothetical protein